MISRIVEFLACPDDNLPLSINGGRLVCEACRRFFPLIGDNFVELLPSSSIEYSGTDYKEAEYFKEYRDCFLEPFVWDNNALAWGVLDEWEIKRFGKRTEEYKGTRFRADNFFSRSYRTFMRHRLREIEYGMGLAKEWTGIACDISGGAGEYSRRLSARSEILFHCDLDTRNLNYVFHRFKELSISNVFFVRCDYLQPPFQPEVFDTVFCMDTLIRGSFHDTLLLKNLLKLTQKGGLIICDFHNPCHNPLNVVISRGFVSQNKSYSYKELRRFLRSLDINNYSRFKFVQEVKLSNPLYPLFQRIFSPSFNIVQIRK
jgi:ubiquinone/menaquinone biosynthesis C-methylase UbiE/uncharacterized protein YbaR (Trm112 family)